MEANIWGGGEYGPRWHQAALKADRNHRSIDMDMDMDMDNIHPALNAGTDETIRDEE